MKSPSEFKKIVSIFLMLLMLTFVGCNKAEEIKNDTANVEKTDAVVKENTPVEESEIEDDEELGFVVTEKRQKCAFINEKGEAVMEFDVEKDSVLPIEPFSSNGLAIIQNSEGKYGYINKKGEIVIEPQFDKVTAFGKNNLAPVMIGDKCGVINQKGERIIDIKYDNSTFFRNGFIIMNLGELYIVFDEGGNTVLETQLDMIGYFAKNGLAVAGVRDNDFNYTYGYIDKNGEWVITPQFDNAGEFTDNGLACVSYNGKCGYINENGEFVIEPQFESAGNFHENGLALMTVGGKTGAINEKGEIVIQPKYDSLCQFCENGLILALIGDGSLKEDNYFYMNANEEIIIDNQSVTLRYMMEDAETVDLYGVERLTDLVPIEQNDKFGYMDNTGKIVIEPIYDYTYPYVSANGLIAVKKDGKWGYINEKGDIIIEPQFYDANPFS